MENVNEIIKQMQEAAVKLWKNEDNSYLYIQKYMADWNQNLTNMVNELAYYAEHGVDIPLDLVIQQIKNLNDGLEKQDDFLLADTLQFELPNALQFYKEIKELSYEK